MTLLGRARSRVLREWEWYSDKLLCRWVFIHINKTGGSSIEHALGLRFEHKTALEKRADLGAWLWNRKFRFTFVRNPWDRVASHYHYRVMTDQTGLGDRHLSFGDWVRLAYGEQDPRYCDQPKMFQAQWRWIADEAGNSMVHFVGRFERLAEDFAALTRQLGIEAELPHLKGSSRGRKPYQGEYDAETREIVARVFAEDIEHFGYEFD